MEEVSIMSYTHIAGGILAGIISFLFTRKGLLPVTNEMIGVLISLIIVYALGKYAEKKFGREKISLSSWLTNGVLPFYFMWMTVWILLLNYITF
ncbi:MAG: hypothetical protein BZ138_00580 [Methanosphaera sp. rholeuAM270]|nr:MAG: hypothetical protein BZ138_00580 [Methanosphaera sp. rholeuAM270]